MRPLKSLAETPKSDHDQIRDLVAEFLRGIEYQAPHSKPDKRLRSKVREEYPTWGMNLSPARAEKALYNGINIAETAYGHLPWDNRYFIAKNTVFFFYTEDLCERDPEAVGRFQERFSRGQKQPDPILDQWAELLKTAFDFWPSLCASAIVASMLDYMYGTYLEAVTPNLKVNEAATRYPWFVRQRTGAGIAYANFVFPKALNKEAASFVQVMP